MKDIDEKREKTEQQIENMIVKEFVLKFAPSATVSSSANYVTGYEANEGGEELR